MTVLEFAGETHPGHHRETNQDVIGWAIPSGVWLVADGMGGYASGDVASRIVKETVLKGAAEPDFALSAALLKAHQSILAAVAEEPDRAGMGSTAVVVQILDRRCRYAWCGDSRAYVWRANKLERLTRDHSVLQGRVDAGKISQTQALGQPDQNILTQALGKNEPRPDEVEMELRSRDWLVLCSDGMHDTLPDREIERVLKASDSPSACTHALMQRALELDAKDNVSVIVIRCPEYPDDPLPAAGNRRFWWIIAMVIAVAVAAAIATGS